MNAKEMEVNSECSVPHKRSRFWTGAFRWSWVLFLPLLMAPDCEINLTRICPDGTECDRNDFTYCVQQPDLSYACGLESACGSGARCEGLICCDDLTCDANNACVAGSPGPACGSAAGKFCCPDGVKECNEDKLCRLISSHDYTYECIDPADCVAGQECIDTINPTTGECCQLGSKRIDDPNDPCRCGRADMIIKKSAFVLSEEWKNFDPSDCALDESEGPCVDQAGCRRLLKFNLKTPNLGPDDLYVGDPADWPDDYQQSSCHGHKHLKSYATYELIDLADPPNVVTSGGKRGFCLVDLDWGCPIRGPAQYLSCSNNQGISACWADVYDKELPCQWIDITDVAPGTYKIRVKLNTRGRLAESDYSNNWETSNERTINFQSPNCP